MALALAAVGCDDPTPVVLGRLQIRVSDAGNEPVDAGDGEHERDREHDDDDDEHARAEPSER
jgi:hypothetical protein